MGPPVLEMPIILIPTGPQPIRLKGYLVENIPKWQLSKTNDNLAWFFFFFFLLVDFPKSASTLQWKDYIDIRQQKKGLINFLTLYFHLAF